MSPTPDPDLAAAALQRDLDAPLPPELSGRTHGWLTRYRSYPVFSAPWARQRTVVLLAWLVPLFVVVMAPAIVVPSGDGALPLGGIAQLAVQVFVPVVLGPWLGVLVRRRRWPEPRERRALAAAVGAVVVAILAFHQWGAEPVKQ